MKRILSLFLVFSMVLAVCVALSPQTQINTKTIIENHPVFANNSSEIISKVIDFEDGVSGWGKHSDCKIDLEISADTVESNCLSVNCAYDASTEYDWNNAPIISSPLLAWQVGEATHIAVDVYTDAPYEDNATNVTPFIISPQYENKFITAGANFNLNDGELVGNYRKHTVSLSLTNTDKVTMSSTDVIDNVVIVASGVSTDYSGKLFFDNVRLVKYGVVPQEKFEIANVNIKNSWKLIKNEEIQITCTAVGKEAPYNYTVYALKDGKVCYKSSVRQADSTVVFTLPDAGNYTVMVYCQSSDDSKTLCKVQKSITVYNDTTEVPKQKAVALTFDDGPDFYAGELLDTLKKKDVKATFFVLYSNGACNPTLIKRAYDEGHQIGNHTYSHEYLVNMTQEQAIFEIETVNNYIESITGEKPHVYRPPYLAYNNDVLSWFPDMSSITCSVDSRDWAGLSKDEIVNRVTKSTANGDIILLHEPQANTRAAISEIIDYFHENGFECVTVDELFERKGITMLPGKNYNDAR